MKSLGMKSWHEVLIHKGVQREAALWCEEHFGKRWQAMDNRDGVWAVFWAGQDNFSTYQYIFANEQDMILFILRWA